MSKNLRFGARSCRLPEYVSRLPELRTNLPDQLAGNHRTGSYRDESGDLVQSDLTRNRRQIRTLMQLPG